jgi:hypothetical protein
MLINDITDLRRKIMMQAIFWQNEEPDDLYLIGYDAVGNDKRSVSNHKIVEGSIF